MTAPPSLERRLFDFLERADADHFEALALDVFAYQYAHNAPYRAFCDRRSLTPERVKEWQHIPAVVTAAFKAADLTCRPKQPSAYFLTSGTTQGNDRRGRHLMASLPLYRAAILPNAQRHLFPDLAELPDGRLQILSLTPSPPLRPHSSLIHMIDVIIQQWGTASSGYFGAAEGLDANALAWALACAADEGWPVALLGTTAAFLLFFDHCAGQGLTFALPEGSRIMDTGGNKRSDGRRQPSDDREAFLHACEHYLDVPAPSAVNEYGMTELSSQFYDDVRTGAKAVPHWVRVRVIDPASGEDAPAGKAGLLRIYDLANLHSVMAIQTDDVGIRSPMQSNAGSDRFHLLGRAAGAEPRGCSFDPSAATLILQ